MSDTNFKKDMEREDLIKSIKDRWSNEINKRKEENSDFAIITIKIEEKKILEFNPILKLMLKLNFNIVDINWNLFTWDYDFTIKIN